MATRGEAAGYYNEPSGNQQQYRQQQQGGYGYDNTQQQYQNGYQEQYGPPPGHPQYAQNQGPPQQYSQAPPNYGQNFAPQGFDNGGKPTFEEAFKIEKPKWNDLWAGILFLVVCAGFVAVSGIAISGYASTKGFQGGGIYDGGNDFSLDTNTLVLFVFCLASALVISYSYVMLARTFPKAFIWTTGILNIIFGFVTAIYMLSRRYYSGGIVFLLFSIFTVICFVSWIPRIPFSALMLTTSVDVARKYGHVWLVSFIGGILATAFGAYYSVTLVAVYTKYQPGNNPACNQAAGGCSNAKVIGLIVFITFAAYWITEWLKNTIHTIISGVYGSWYFCADDMPKGPTRGAAKRALTYSFGSISLGSLVVAIINMLRQFCSVAQNNARSDGNIAAYVCFCILGCLISILDWAVQFLNRYAYSYIALYGKSYIAAAKETWSLIKDRGIDALVNECLIGPVLTMGATFVGYFCALLAYLYLIFTNPEYNRDGSFTPVVVAFAFLIGLQICQIFTTPISSGIDTIFVAAAFDPAVMVNKHPELYHKLVQVYPHVQQAIHA